MSRLRYAVACVFVVAVGGVLLAGCGSDSSTSSTSTPAAAPAATTPPATAPANTTGGASDTATPTGTVAISMKNIAFAPKDDTVHVGDTVKWTNDDTVEHNVKADTGATFSSDNFGQGGTFEYTPKKLGKITYECTIHPGMTGTLNVVK